MYLRKISLFTSFQHTFNISLFSSLKLADVERILRILEQTAEEEEHIALKCKSNVTEDRVGGGCGDDSFNSANVENCTTEENVVMRERILIF